MSTTLYDLASANEQKKIESDIIYNVLMNKETTLLDRLLTEIIDTTKKNHTDMSKRYHSMTERHKGQLKNSQTWAVFLWSVPVS